MEVVINLLTSILSSNRATSLLDLEFSQLNSITPLLPHLSQFRALKQLSLHGNRLTELPEDLSELSSLEELDISNNLIPKLEVVLPGLKTLPSLRKLSINIKSKEEEAQLLRELPSLQFLNNEKVARRSSNNLPILNQTVPPPLFEQSKNEQQGKEVEEEVKGISHEELENLGRLYDLIKEVFKEVNSESEPLLAAQFDEHVGNILGDLKSKVPGKASPSKSLVIKAKYALYEICFSKFLDFLDGIDHRLATIFESLHDSHALIFKEMSGLENNSENLGRKKNEAAEIQQFMEVAEHFQSENQRLSEENRELLDQIGSLEKENQKLLDLVIKHSKGEKSTPSTTQDLSKCKTAGNKENSSKPLNSTPLQQQNQSENIIDRPFFSNLKTGQAKSAGFNTNIGKTNVRTLSLKQLKDTIDEINDSKLKYDKKCYELKMPRETMEQHMYSFLNQKYGLKNLIIEWAMAIINGIKRFCFEDNDVTVFAKVLRNECDEEFRLVQNQVKNTICELLRMHLRGKFPFKHSSEIKELADSKVSSYIYIDESQDIIKYMYNKEDAEAIFERVQEFQIMPRKAVGREMNTGEKEKPKVPFAAFQKAILDFQLKSHELFLGNFVKTFKQEDHDNNGIIDESEFRELVASMKLDLDVEKLLDRVDPFNHQNITFSELVTLFSSEMVTTEGKTLSLLQVLSMYSENA